MAQKGFGLSLQPTGVKDCIVLIKMTHWYCVLTAYVEGTKQGH